MARPWTKNEIYTLEENIDKLTLRRARRLFPDRTETAIFHAVYRFGINEKTAVKRGLYYSIPRLAAVLGVDVRTVRYWIADGLLEGAEGYHGFRGSGQRKQWRVPIESVDNFLENYPMLFAALPDPPEGAEDHRPALAQAREKTEWLMLNAASKRMNLSVSELGRRAREGEVDAKRVGWCWWIPFPKRNKT